MDGEVAKDKDDRNRNHCRPYLCDDARRYAQVSQLFGDEASLADC